MKRTLDVLLQIRDSSRPPAFSKLEVIEVSRPRRLLRALLRWVALWTLAIGLFAMALMPFVFVAMILVLGPLVAGLAYRPAVTVESTSFTCPKCNQPSTIKQGLKGWPVRLICSECGTTLFARPVRRAAQGTMDRHSVAHAKVALVHER